MAGDQVKDLMTILVIVTINYDTSTELLKEIRVINGCWVGVGGGWQAEATVASGF